MVKNLTTGSPLKLIIGFSIPLLIGNLFQQFYTMVDTIIVGRYVGIHAMAAVGAAGSLTYLMTGFVFGLCPGLCVPVSMEFGSERYDSMRRYVTNGLYVGIFISVLMAIVSSLGARTFIRWMNTPAEIAQDAWIYCIFLFLAMPITFMYNYLSSVMRSLGDSRTPLYFLIFASFLNIPLNIFFIVVMHWGTAGVSIATVISQLISALLCLIYMRRKFTILHFKKGDWKWSTPAVKRLVNIGLPMGFQHSITAIGSTVLQTATNGFGADTVAAVTASTRVVCFFFQAINTIGLAMATWCSQNIGARKLDRVYQGLKLGYLLGFGYSAFIAAFSFIWGDEICALFLSGDYNPMIMVQIRQFLLVTSIGYPFLTSLMVLRNSIQGLGYSFLAMFSGVMEMSARVILAFFLVKPFGYAAICFTFTAPWMIANLLLIPGIIYVLKDVRKKMAVA